MCYNVLKKESKMSPFPMFTFFWYFTKKEQNSKNLAGKLKTETRNFEYFFMILLTNFQKTHRFLKDLKVSFSNENYLNFRAKNQYLNI